MENYRRLFRPTMGWVSIPLIAFGFLAPDYITEERLVILLSFAGGLFVMRGVEKINGKD